MTLVVENLLVLLPFEVLVQVVELLVKPLVFNLAIPDGLIKHVLVLLVQIGQLDALLGLKSVDGSLGTLSSLLHPGLLLLSFNFEDLLLDLVGFCESKWAQ